MLAQQLSFAKRLRSRRSPEESGSFWQKRYYDRNVRNYREFTVKLRYLHRNPVKRGLVLNPEEWKWSSYRHYAQREIGIVEIESWRVCGQRARQGSSYCCLLNFRYNQIAAAKQSSMLIAPLAQLDRASGYEPEG